MKNNWNRKECITSLKELLSFYKDDKYICENSSAHIKYKDGTTLFYPDDIEKIKLTHIINIHFMNCSCSMDFNFDDITTLEAKEFLGIEHDNNYGIPFKNQLVVDDMNEYYKNHF